jgi:hypothetical protein
MLGMAIATMVWSMKVIETAKIIAARISPLLLPPVFVHPQRLMQPRRVLPPTGRNPTHVVGNRPIGRGFR